MPSNRGANVVRLRNPPPPPHTPAPQARVTRACFSSLRGVARLSASGTRPASPLCLAELAFRSLPLPFSCEKRASQRATPLPLPSFPPPSFFFICSYAASRTRPASPLCLAEKSTTSTRFVRTRSVRTRSVRTRFVRTCFVRTRFVRTRFERTRFVRTRFVRTRFVRTRFVRLQLLFFLLQKKEKRNVLQRATRDRARCSSDAHSVR